MRHVRMLCLCLVAVFACTAVAAASASAQPQPELSPAVPGTPIAAKTKNTTFYTTGVGSTQEKVLCKKGAASGKIADASHLEMTWTFTKCEGNGNKKNTCGNVAPGTIETKEHVALFYLDEPGTKPGILVDYVTAPVYGPAQDLDFTCGTEPVEEEFPLVGKIAATGKSVTLTFNVAGGKQEYHSFWFEGEENPFGLEEASLVSTQTFKLKGAALH